MSFHPSRNVRLAVYRLGLERATLTITKCRDKYSFLHENNYGDCAALFAFIPSLPLSLLFPLVPSPPSLLIPHLTNRTYNHMKRTQFSPFSCTAFPSLFPFLFPPFPLTSHWLWLIQGRGRIANLLSLLHYLSFLVLARRKRWQPCVQRNLLRREKKKIVYGST